MKIENLNLLNLMFLLRQLGGSLITLCLEKITVLHKRYCEAYAKRPTKAYADSAGYDLYAAQTKLLRRGERGLVRLDLQFAIPKGYYGSIVGRSGLANTKSIIVFPGTVDAGYRGIVGVIHFNLSDDCYKVEIGNHIAQIIIRKCCDVNFIECSPLDFEQYCHNERGTDGFGSSSGF